MKEFGSLRVHGYSVEFIGNIIVERGISGLTRKHTYTKEVTKKAMEYAENKELSELEYLLENARMMGGDAVNAPTLAKVVGLMNEEKVDKYIKGKK